MTTEHLNRIIANLLEQPPSPLVQDFEEVLGYILQLEDAYNELSRESAAQIDTLRKALVVRDLTISSLKKQT